MIQTGATITRSRRLAAGVVLHHLAAPDIAQRVRPGQFVLIRCTDGDDPYLRRPFPVCAIAPAEVAILVRGDEPGRRWLAHQPVGRAVDVLGPVGHGFDLHPTTQRLLLVAEGLGIAALTALAVQGAAKGLAVTMLAGAPNAFALLPTDLLPTEVEYRVATADGSRGLRGSVTSLLPDVIAWADQVCASGSPTLYHALAAVIARYRLIAGDDFAQVWQLGTTGCGLGVCQACVVETKHGPVLSCRQGPVFRLREIEAW